VVKEECGNGKSCNVRSAVVEGECGGECDS